MSDKTTTAQEAPMTERQAITLLAEMVGYLAYRCWEALGTDSAQRIHDDAHTIAEAFRG